LALRVQARVGRGAVHRGRRDELAVLVGHEHRHRAGGRGHDLVDDRARLFETHPRHTKSDGARLRSSTLSAAPFRCTPYPLVLPKTTAPRLHLAAVITTLQVLGQVAFHFRLSIAQILVSLLTCAVLEVAITLRKQHVLMWPASALLTGNGVAFILRVPGTQHGDWWSMNGWWIFMATAAVSLLSKYVIVWRQGHVF